MQTKDLRRGQLKAMAARATQKATELKSKKVPEQSRVKADLSDPSKWVFGDIKEYGRIMTEIQSDVKEIKEKQMLLKKSLKELESSMLKGWLFVLRLRTSVPDIHDIQREQGRRRLFALAELRRILNLRRCSRSERLVQNIWRLSRS